MSIASANYSSSSCPSSSYPRLVGKDTGTSAASFETIDAEEVDYYSDEEGVLTAFVTVDGEKKALLPRHQRQEDDLGTRRIDHYLYEDTHTFDCLSSLIPCFGSCTRTQQRSSSPTEPEEGTPISTLHSWYVRTKNQLARSLTKKKSSTATGDQTSSSTATLKNKAYTRLASSLKDKSS